MTYSKFGKKFTKSNAISQLMDDLGKANHSNNPNIIMLGGGNPALIPEASECFIAELSELINSSKATQMIGLYDAPQGNEAFINALVDMFNKHYPWELRASNIALTNGSQSSFFSLFNLLAGEMPDGSQKKILFPLAPEYVGYADQGLSDKMFSSVKPEITLLDNKQFKYQIDFDALHIDKSIAAICVSRPTNPTGNVITDQELAKLDQLAQQHQIPLIIDNAYGLPFPAAVYTDAELSWNQNTILCLSLSKLGLPGLRTGIVIANDNIIHALRQISGIMTLAPNGVGSTLLTRMVKNDELLPLCHTIIKPYYQQKAMVAIELFKQIFADLPVYLHKLEGAFFMWLWFKDMGVNSDTLYQQLKQQDVYIISGSNFFMGIDDAWEHQYQCIRINYAKDKEELKKGLEIIRNTICKSS